MRKNKQRFVGVVIYNEKNGKRKYLFTYDFENELWSFLSVRVKDYKGEFRVISNKLKELGIDGDFMDYKDYMEIAPYAEIDQEMHIFLFKSEDLVVLPDFKWMDLEEANRTLILSEIKEVIARVDHVLNSQLKSNKF